MPSTAISLANKEKKNERINIIFYTTHVITLSFNFPMHSLYIFNKKKNLVNDIKATVFNSHKFIIIMQTCQSLIKIDYLSPHTGCERKSQPNSRNRHRRQQQKYYIFKTN